MQSISNLQEYYQILHDTLQLRLRMHLQSFLNEQCGLLPASINLAETEDVLDVACGSGQWVYDMARKYPRIHLTGLDTWENAIHHARASTVSLPNTHFLLGDLQPTIPLANHAFDLLHASFLAPRIAPYEWQTFLRDLQRLCRPGGTIIWQEADLPQTNSPACSQWCEMLQQVLSRSGKTASSTHMMDVLLYDAGFQDIQTCDITLSISTGTPLHSRLYRHLPAILDITQPLLFDSNLASTREIDRLCCQAILDLYEDDFTATWSLRTVIGKKPLENLKK